MSLREEWDAEAHRWISWARAPGHDSYWRFHRDAFLPLVPEAGSLTIDVGCGEGRVARDLVALGHRVVALDSSPRMTRAAAEASAGVSVVCGDARALPLPAASADCAVAFMCLQDVDDLVGAIQEMARVVRRNGRLAMAITHPANTAGGFEGQRGDPQRPFVIAGSWFATRRVVDDVERDGLSMRFTSEHRPLQTYMDALTENGFLVEKLAEVTEPDPAHAWHRMPLFLHIRALRTGL